jgi:hypothetical protein
MRGAAIAALLLPWAALAQTAAGPPRLELPLAGFLGGAAVPQPPFGQRLTLLLNVGSVLLRGGSFSGGPDHRLMYAAISALSHRAAAVELVVFDANRQHELLRLEAFSLADLRQVTAAMEKWQLGPVDYHALQRDQSSGDIVAGLINEQLRADPRPDLVVFVDPGSRERIPDRSARRALKIPAGARPRFFALQFGPPSSLFYSFPMANPNQTEPRPAAGAASGGTRTHGPGGAFPRAAVYDKIRPAVAKLDGKTFFMSSSGELPKAIAEIEKRAGRKP